MDCRPDDRMLHEGTERKRKTGREGRAWRLWAGEELAYDYATFCPTMSEATVFTAVQRGHTGRWGEKPAVIKRGET